MSNNVKICSKCHKQKNSLSDFYCCKGNIRGECKACTIERNVNYQRKKKSWKNRFVDNDVQRSYMVEYYRRNKEQFAAYRKKFKEKYPDYYREYSRNRKMKKNE